MGNKAIDVSICCITFNHENFIKFTLEGFVNQKTTCNYEIIIGEDASTDSTRKIITEYEKLYPNLIKLLPLKTNIGMNRNFKRTLESCNGKYIAICEGDDYWVDLEKIEKQWTYLEKNPQTVISYGKAHSLTGIKIDESYIGGFEQDLEANNLLAGVPLNTLTTMFRNVLNPLPNELLTAGACDLFIWSMLGHHGNGKFCDNIKPSIYRIHENGVHSMKPMVEKLILRLMTRYSLFLYYRRIGRSDLQEFYQYATEDDVKNIITTGGFNLLDSIPTQMGKKADPVASFDTYELKHFINNAILKL